MSENEQTQEQAPAPFAVGQQVRCVDVQCLTLSTELVYTVSSYEGWSKILSLVGEGSYAASRFVPAVAFVDGSGKKWLVVDERVPDGRKDTWVDWEGRVCVPGKSWSSTDASCNGGRRRILSEWQEFPVHCSRCEDELKTPGALLFSPPFGPIDTCVKRHLCGKCYDAVLELACAPPKPPASAEKESKADE